MALPDIAGYLASTRQTLDLAGPALDAFQTVSSEMRATRAQNLAEEESARDLGKGIKEGMQKDRMFEENILDMRQQRMIAAQDQEFEAMRLGMDQMRLGMDMEEHRFNMQNLMPLEIQERQLGMARQQQIYDAAAMEMETERSLRSVGLENLNRVRDTITGKTPVPAEAIDTAAGETADSPQARVRATANQLGMLESLIRSTGDKGLAAQYQNYQRLLQADPMYQSMSANDGLMMPGQKAERSNRRVSLFKSMLPFDDAGSAAFIERNNQSVMTMINGTDKEFDAISSRLLNRADIEYRDSRQTPLPTAPRTDPVGERNRHDEIAKTRAEVAAAKAVVEQKKANNSPLGMEAAMGAFLAAEARLKSLEESYQGLIPSLPDVSLPATATGESGAADFYK
jgi:hypothetical protein